MHFLKYTIRSIVWEASHYPVIWSSILVLSSCHPVIWSSCNVVILSSGHPVIPVILVFVPKLLTD